MNAEYGNSDLIDTIETYLTRDNDLYRRAGERMASGLLYGATYAGEAMVGEAGEMNHADRVELVNAGVEEWTDYLEAGN